MPPKKFFTKSAGFKKTSTFKKKDTHVNLDATYLIIVESPSKCSKIEHFLGDDYCCIASKGHLRTVDGLKSIDTKGSFQPKFSIIEEKRDHVEYMRSIIDRFQKANIILASDDDREGEAIAWHICQLFDLPVDTTPRILFHEITKTAILEAVKNPTRINMPMVLAQHARQVLDIIVGYKISPFLWKYLYNNKSNSLSAGRCQTPALRLVYDNEKEKNAAIETKYKTTASITAKNLIFDLNYEFDTEVEVLDFLEKSKEIQGQPINELKGTPHLAECPVSNLHRFQHYLKCGSPKNTVKSAPKPFNTSRLLQVASNQLHLSPKDTMSLCQLLYQNGYITYMRTDSQKYSAAFLKQAEKYIMDEYGNTGPTNEKNDKKYLGNFEVLENKDVNNPHEAIRITQIDTRVIPDCQDNRMLSLYKLIWRNTIESCMADAQYNSTGIIVSAPNDKQYKYTIEIPIHLGWKKVDATTKETKETDEINIQCSLLMYLKNLETSGKPVGINYVDTVVVVRNRHQHYTEASLINMLEELGIGRPSTFATIVETIQDRGYVKLRNIEGEKVVCREFKLRGKVLEHIEKEKIFGNEKNKLVIQPVGILTIEFLLYHFETLFSYDYTKTMEEQLDIVSNGGADVDWSSVCKKCYTEIKEQSKRLTSLEKQVYPIDETHDFVFEKYGPVIRERLDGGEYSYKPVKKDLKIDIEKIKARQYTLDELYEIKNNNLGDYEGSPLYIKTGKFGPYVEWSDKTESIKDIGKPLDQIVLADVIEMIEKKKNKEVFEIENMNKNMLRVLTDEYSVRKGKFGAYVYYKRVDMKKPEFFNTKAYPGSLITDDVDAIIQWITRKYPA
jgi:DNA topoisomerase-1